MLGLKVWSQWGVVCFALVSSQLARAQEVVEKPAQEPAPAAAAPSVAPAPQPTVPPGYMLVPAPSEDARTRYDVQYPQARGALPPGMELPYEEGDQIPAGYRLRHQPRRGLIIAGAVLTGTFWTLSMTGAAEDNFDHKSGFLVLPVLGPWLMLAAGGARDRDCETSDSGHCGDEPATRALLVLDGLVQTAGAAMLISGIAFPRKRLVRSDVTIGLAPSPVGEHGYGATAVGTF
jgi:hypothetical protein